MPSNLSTIGFSTNSTDEFKQLAMKAANLGDSIPLGKGSYTRWKTTVGSEIWVQFNSEMEYLGLNPHFSGKAKMRVGITKKIQEKDLPMDGAFYSWSNPPKDNPEDGYYPFVFDTPDFLLHSELTLPRIVNVQMAAFARELEGWETEADFAASQSEEKLKWAIESFIPSGLFSIEGKSLKGKTNKPPEAYAVFTGRILQTSLLTNPITGEKFYWAHVHTLGGEVDVVADPEIVQGELEKDGIVQGSFWLSGRILND